jgi:hypothetical protein
VVIKVNSLWNAAYQNAVVRGEGTKPNANSDHFTELRNEAIKILMEEGFADCEPTRLAFDTIVCKQNVKEIPSLHMHARDRNIFILLVNYLPSGRSSDGLQDALDRSEQALLFDELARIDADKYSLNHRAIFPYAGGVPCSIRGTGIFVKITGNVFDCPGEMIPLGTTRGESLAEIWERARPITRALNGGCAPRDAFWANESFRLKPHRVTQIQGLQRVRASAPRSLF